MKNRIFFFVFFIALSIDALTQKLLYSADDDNAKIIGVDKFGNGYVLQDAVLKKLDVKGNVLYSYSEKSKGSIGYVDITNPLKILILHDVAQEVVVVENTLSKIGTIFKLADFGLSEVSLVCSASENGFWAYDMVTGIFSFITGKGLIANVSNDIRRFAPSGFSPQQIGVYDTMLYVYDAEHGIVVMDKAGNFIKFIQIEKLPLSISMDGVYFAENTGFTLLNRHFNTHLAVNIPVETMGIERFHYCQPYIFIQKNKIFSLFLLSD